MVFFIELPLITPLASKGSIRPIYLIYRKIKCVLMIGDKSSIVLSLKIPIDKVSKKEKFPWSIGYSDFSKYQAGRGHWVVYYTSPQNFIITVSLRWLNNLGDL